MAIEIRETKILPDTGGDTVQLYVSDAAPGDASASFVLTISAKIPPLEMPLVAQSQREAMKIAQDTLSTLLQKMATEITAAGFGLNPRPRN